MDRDSDRDSFSSSSTTNSLGTRALTIKYLKKLKTKRFQIVSWAVVVSNNCVEERQTWEV
jgi:hypothetical protein